MFNSEILEVAIGVVFTFLVASLVATAIREIVEAVLKTRAVQLERGIRQLLDDPSGKAVTKELFDHPLLFGLFAGSYDPSKLTTFWLARQDTPADAAGAKRVPFGTNLPNYIPSRNFAMALLDLVGGSGADGGPLSMESLKANVLTLPDSKVKQALVVALGEAKNDIDRARASVEAWFDSNMDRVSGWYKRETQWLLLGFGLLLAVSLNIDAISIARELASNNTVRRTLLATIEKQMPETKQLVANPSNAAPADQQKLGARLDDLSDVIGWPRLHTRVAQTLAASRQAFAEQVARNPNIAPGDRAVYVKHHRRSQDEQFWLIVLYAIPGWIATALAVSLGAPFWFDVLNKFMVIRSTVKPYEKSPAEGSEDRQGSVPSADRLEPQQTPAARGGGAAMLAGGAGADAVGPITAALRLAVDKTGLDPASIVLKVNGATVDLPQDGRIELEQPVGHDCVLEVTAVRAGEKITWTKTVPVTVDTDGLALLAP